MEAVGFELEVNLLLEIAKKGYDLAERCTSSTDEGQLRPSSAP